MTLSRHDFLRGALASLGFGALRGGRIFAAPQGWKHGGRPNLVFGVISDTHLISSRRMHEEMVWTRICQPFGNEKGRPDKYLVSALKYFRDRNVDAVMHCGDMADQGLVSEMQWHADAWRKVFPGDRTADGHKVERLFVTGNHEVEGGDHFRVKREYPDAAERARRCLMTDLPANWRRIWGEPYEDVWHKVVKGYHFLGRNFGEENKAKFAALLADVAARHSLSCSSKPFFIVSHTGYGGSWNRDYRASIRGNLKNAVAFFGHHHWSVANWNRIYFDVIEDFPELQCPPCSCCFNAGLRDADSYIVPVRLEDSEDVGMGRQGFVVSIYDDMVVFERRDFNIPGGSLGSDWVMPLNSGTAKHPLSREELKKSIGKPQFKKNVELKIESVKLESGGDAVRVSIPLADGNPDSRVYAYEVVVAGDEGAPKLRKAVYAAGCNIAVGTETTLAIPANELPQGKTLVVAARPVTSMGTKGDPISARISPQVLKNMKRSAAT